MTTINYQWKRLLFVCLWAAQLVSTLEVNKHNYIAQMLQRAIKVSNHPAVTQKLKYQKHFELVLYWFHSFRGIQVWFFSWKTFVVRSKTSKKISSNQAMLPHLVRLNEKTFPLPLSVCSGQWSRWMRPESSTSPSCLTQSRVNSMVQREMAGIQEPLHLAIGGQLQIAVVTGKNSWNLYLTMIKNGKAK